MRLPFPWNYGRKQLDSNEFDTEAIAKEISDENYATIDQLFRSAGEDPPTFDWSPVGETLRPVALGRLLDYWENLRGERDLPESVEIDPVDFGFALGNILLAEFTENRTDLRYRVYGTNITNFSGFDLTGKSISQSNIPPRSRMFYLATYKATYHRRAPVFTVNYPTRRETLRQWNRITLPFVGADGEVDRFVVGIFPIEHIP